METHTLLIADSDEQFLAQLRLALEEGFAIRCCREGHEALALLDSFRPELLVLDLLLPGLDGISLLQAAQQAGLHPTVLATTRFCNDYILESLAQLKVEYLMSKPCDIQATARHIRDLSQRSTAQAAPEDPRDQVSRELLLLGFTGKHNGFAYLREAVYLMAQDPGQSITKGLYPAVAEICGCAGTHVEHSIRTAIAAAWEKGDGEAWLRWFPAEPGRVPRKPTNTTFITRLAQSLRV